VTRMIENLSDSPRLVEAVAALSVMTHFDGFQRGVFNTRDVVFFLAMIGFSLFTTSVIIRAHRVG
jgi:ABC-2 type transport system permease protein